MENYSEKPLPTISQNAINMKHAKTFLMLLGSIALSHAAGAIGSLATFSSVDTWYLTLAKPVFTPPGWVFGPVWLTLYTLMGIALFLILQKKPSLVRKAAITLFLAQLALNALWSLVFFGLQDVGLALVNILLLLLLVGMTMVFFFRLHKVAGWLLVPYLLWGAFATALNISILLLN